MFDFIFDRIIQQSFSGSIVALIIIAIKAIFKDKFSLKWHYLIWMVLIIKLLMPIDIESDYGLIPKLEFQNQIEESNSNTLDSIDDNLKLVDLATINYNELNSSKSIIQIESVYNVLKIFWLIMVLIQVAYKFHVEFLFYFKQKKLQKLSNQTIDKLLGSLKDQIGIKNKVEILIDRVSSTPKVYGIISPKIIISEKVLYTSDISSIRHIFLHELCHIKQRDILINILRSTLMCLYFFNPIIVWSLKKMESECESSCDERVLKNLASEEHKSYGYTLISLIDKHDHKKNTLVLSLCRKKNITRRLKMINTYRKISLKTKIVSLIIGGLIVGSCLLTPFTSAEQNDNIDNEIIEATNNNEKIISETNINEKNVKSVFEFINPLDSFTITSYYGSHFNDSIFHDGIDIAAPLDEEILASESGKVVYIDLNDSKYGKMIVIEHSDSIKTLYAQCNEILVEVNELVEKGEAIAKVGSSGKSTGPHLHFALLKNDIAIDPKLMMDWIE